VKCDKCGKDKKDAMRRLFLGSVLIPHGFFEYRNDMNGQRIKDKDGTDVKFAIDPALCMACCAEMPGQAWMKNSIPADDASAA